MKNKQSIKIEDELMFVMQTKFPKNKVMQRNEQQKL